MFCPSSARWRAAGRTPVGRAVGVTVAEGAAGVAGARPAGDPALRVRSLDSAFEPVLDRFARTQAELGDDGAALVVELHGRRVLDVVGGNQADDGLQVIRSVSKAVLALVTWVLHDRQVLDVDAPVADLWPEFAQGGKAAITTRTLLSHTAGLPNLGPEVDVHDLLRWTPAVQSLERQEPVWEPGTANGYHDLTFGWLVGEVVRRATGRSVGELVQELLSGPLGLELWIGTPREVLPRVHGLLRDRTEGPRQVFPDGTRPDGAGRTADVSRVEHTVEYLGAEVPAANGVSDARSLTRLFSAAIGAGEGSALVSGRTLRDAVALRSEGEDLVVGWFRRYGSGFMLPDPTRPMGGEGTGTFGHYGQGGALAFAQPDLGLSFAYLTRRDRSFLGADPRTAELAALALSCAGGGR